MTELATEENKNPSPPEWTLLYHGAGKKFKGRGEFVRLMLEDAGVSYEYSGDGLYGPNGMMDCFRGSTQAILENNDSTDIPFPIFFPPAIWHRPPPNNNNGEEAVIVNQVAACMIYVGDMLGYAPSTPAERARATTVTLNALDYISDGRLSFHPVKSTMSYHDQKEQGDKASLEFTKTRMLLFLAHFEKVVKVHGSKAPVAGGEKVTFADFALFHVLDATIAQFNNEKYDMVWDKQKDLSALKEYHAWMKSRPKLQAYFNSDYCSPWAGDSMM